MGNINNIMRLLQYKDTLKKLKSLGFIKVFSDNIADAGGVSSSLVRKDFFLLGISGNKRGGYNIDKLIEQLNNILGKNEVQKVVIAGAGNVGKALMHYKGFEEEYINIIAVFDIDPGKHDPEARIPILPMEEMQPFIAKNGIKIGIIALPDEATQRAADLMILGGIRGILNFGSVGLRLPGHCVESHVNLELELERLIYLVKSSEKKDLSGKE